MLSHKSSVIPKARLQNCEQTIAAHPVCRKLILAGKLSSEGSRGRNDGHCPLETKLAGGEQAPLNAFCEGSDILALSRHPNS
jgi:hypothetical protein